MSVFRVILLVHSVVFSLFCPLTRAVAGQGGEMTAPPLFAYLGSAEPSCCAEIEETAEGCVPAQALSRFGEGNKRAGIYSSASPSAAEVGDADISDEILGELENALPEGLEELADPKELTEKMSFSELWGEIISAISGAGGYACQALMTMLGLSVLLSVGERSGAALSDSAAAISQAVAGASLFGLLSPAVTTVAEALSAERGLMEALVPLMTSTTLAGGGTLSAGVQSAGSGVVLWAIGYLGEPLLVGLCYAMLLLGVAGNMSGAGARVAASVRNAFVKAIGMVTAAFSGVIALQSVIASAQDNALMRVAKHATGTLIPVVGVGVSGALGTLAGGLAYASGVVGGAAVMAFLLISLSPLALLLLLKLCLFVVISFLDFCHAPRALSLFSAFEGAINALTSVYVMTTIVCIIQVVIFMKGGVTVLE